MRPSVSRSRQVKAQSCRMGRAYKSASRRAFICETINSSRGWLMGFAIERASDDAHSWLYPSYENASLDRARSAEHDGRDKRGPSARSHSTALFRQIELLVHD